MPAIRDYRYVWPNPRPNWCSWLGRRITRFGELVWGRELSIEIFFTPPASPTELDAWPDPLTLEELHVFSARLWAAYRSDEATRRRIDCMLKILREPQEDQPQ